MVRDSIQRKSTNKRASTAADFDYTIKCVVIGDSGVGKTCILHRLANSKSSMKSTPTIDGVFHKRAVGLAAGQYMQLSIWDTSIPQWIEDVRENSGNSKVVLTLVANKSDLKSERQVPADEGAELARQYNMKYTETSAINLNNIEQVFDVLSEDVYHNITIGNLIPNAQVNGIKIGASDTARRSYSPAEADKKCSC